MKILFRRAQTAGRFRSVKFKLWAKLELDKESDESKIIDRYDFDHAVLIYHEQERLFRNACIFGVIIAVPAFFFIGYFLGRQIGAFGAFVTGAFAAWLFYDFFRETIFVKDLLHGRYFKCRSILELASKEAWLGQMAGYLRAVMESAKHWDGTETQDLPKPDPEIAKQIMLKQSGNI